MKNNIRAKLSYFDYRGRTLYTPALCANNQLHYDLYNKGLLDGSLVTFNNRPAVVASADVSGIEMKGKPLDVWIAEVQALILAQRGMPLQHGIADRLRESLVSSYLLNSCLCVAEVKTQQGIEYYLVTKSPAVLSVYQSQLAPVTRKKGFDQFQVQCSNRYDELAKGSFSAVRVIRDVDGVHLKSRTLGSRSARHLLPYYAVNNYAAAVVRYFSKQKVKLVFSQNGVIQDLITTFNIHTVADWKGVTVAEAQKAVEADWLNPLSLGYLNLPDLSLRGQFVPVPLLHLHEIEPCV
ncbi:hypothetical protein [Ammoniphilus sp. CFH 90114]|uniref:hypothetical protein n=1 Tax=Ammoniphilus sp. CFH 90114 TaxID=2493665 RepID=UPI00100EB31E|nr:hypothetical protein [Ammoniphilus sp. CFH 90114]RXT08832.1 hypothetical protein EIZ39_08510 [Ammoniphilus sp. CFH 90114]